MDDEKMHKARIRLAKVLDELAELLEPARVGSLGLAIRLGFFPPLGLEDIDLLTALERLEDHPNVDALELDGVPMPDEVQRYRGTKTEVSR
jgi:hypothetical protein